MTQIFGCPNGKIGYLDDTDAMLAILKLGGEHDDRHKTERSYYTCSTCGHLHLTSWRLDD